MIRRLLVSALFLLPMIAQGGGEVPFPLDGENQLTVLSETTMLNETLALLMQVRVYRSLDGGSEAKIWIRAADGFVWDRAWTKIESDVFLVDVELGDREGALTVDLKNGSQLYIDDQIFLFSPQP